jgi:aspartate/methionine/tyrosine aminotransferase
LNKIPGFSTRRPAGAFYVFPDTSATGLNSAALADRLLFDAGVACLAGTCFGGGGEGHVRFSFANSMENLRDGIERVRRCVAEIPVAAR